MNGFFITAAIVAVICVIWWTVKSEKGATSFALSALQGIAAMCAVNLTGLVTGVTLAVNWYTIATFIVLGLPGVIGALVLKFIMAV
ncbi:MAG: pro-sigmaK processing inhibitor BofA family protein [Clostridia bacterium]|nr:pro-sigmaK processing inhibitor BofA family protein [Clostridia bacterium]MBQ7121864.1 pro-sigmaK processing inhibitor BofA family protein [Clostridia bacterium]